MTSPSTRRPTPLTLLVGLGNPGKDYAGNRHNIGFMALDCVAEAYRFSTWSKKFRGLLAEGTIDGKKVLLLKPQTYMNLSGESVSACAAFYKIAPEQVIVFHDELDLALLKIRVKKGGGNGGHNGLKSIDAHLGKEYWRVRLGIAHPGDKDAVSDYVLSDFSKPEKKQVAGWMDAVSTYIPFLLAGNEAEFMNKITLHETPTTKHESRK